jgi:hypothetical protein
MSQKTHWLSTTICSGTVDYEEIIPVYSENNMNFIKISAYNAKCLPIGQTARNTYRIGPEFFIQWSRSRLSLHRTYFGTMKNDV